METPRGFQQPESCFSFPASISAEKLKCTHENEFLLGFVWKKMLSTLRGATLILHCLMRDSWHTLWKQVSWSDGNMMFYAFKKKSVHTT